MGKFVGTGKDEFGRYPAGVEVHLPDEPDGREPALVERGFVARLPADQDPVYDKWSLAQAAVRGDVASLPTDPVALSRARELGLVDDSCRATPLAYAVVAADGAPVATGKRK